MLVFKLSLRNSLLIMAGRSRFNYQLHSLKRYGFQPGEFSDVCALDTIMRFSIFCIFVLLQAFAFLFGTASPGFVFSNSSNNLCYIIALIL
jgi:hypothetical protein